MLRRSSATETWPDPGIQRRWSLHGEGSVGVIDGAVEGRKDGGVSGFHIDA